MRPVTARPDEAAPEAWDVMLAPLAGDRSLRGLPAMKRLSSVQREAVERRMVVRDYRRNAIVYRAGDEARSIYVVLAGVARLSIPTPRGRRVLLHLLPAGELFGHAALVEGGGPRVFEAAAYTDLRIGRVLVGDFLDAVAGPHAHELAPVISFVTERWLTLVLRLARFLTQDLQARVASSLIEAARGFGVEDDRGHVLSVRLTQEAIADLSAGSVRKVNAVLRRFEQQGLLAKEGGRLVLPRLHELETLALAS